MMVRDLIERLAAYPSTMQVFAGDTDYSNTVPTLQLYTVSQDDIMDDGYVFMFTYAKIYEQPKAGETVLVIT